MCGAGDVATIARLFKLLDADGGGSIELAEMKDVLHANPEALKLAKSFPSLDAVTGDASKSHRKRSAKEKRLRRRSTMRKGGADAEALAAQLQAGLTVGTDFKLKKRKRRGSRIKKKAGGAAQKNDTRLSRRRSSVAERLKEFQERQLRMGTTPGPQQAQAAATTEGHELPTNPSIAGMGSSMPLTTRRRGTLKRAFTKLDLGHTGHIDFNAFFTACKTNDRPTARKLFNMLDEDHSGSLEKNELVDVLRKNQRAARLAEHFSGLHALLDSAATEKSSKDSKRSKSDRASKRKRKTDKRFSRFFAKVYVDNCRYAHFQQIS